MGIYDRDYYQAEELGPLRPWDNRSMVTLLIIANAAVFIANYVLTSRTDQITGLLTLRAGDLTSPLHWPRFLTYAFAHHDIWHILFNMVGLYFLGQGVESKYGKWEFFRFYIVSAVACGLIFALMRLEHPGKGVFGASGAVTAVSMLFVFSFPNSVLYLYGAVPVKAWMLGVFIVISNLLGTRSAVNPDGSPAVAYDVHLVGAAFAAIYFYGQLNFGFLAGVVNRSKRTIKQKRSGLKVHRPQEQPSSPTKDELESDRILDKITREGQDSLTKKERAFMQKYSREVRQRRSQQD